MGNREVLGVTEASGLSRIGLAAQTLFSWPMEKDSCIGEKISLLPQILENRGIKKQKLKKERKEVRDL